MAFRLLDESEEPSIRSSCLPSGDASEPSSWAYFHKPIIAMVMGVLMSAVGAVLLLLRALGVSEAPHAMVPACLSAGLVFVVLGLVWIPILRQKQRRRSSWHEGATLYGSERYSVTMSTEVRMEPVTEIQYDGVGRCKCSFWFAVAHDILGLVIMMTGVFGGLVIHDLLIYAGSIIIFLSLIWWVFWYSGNIDVPPEELEDDVGMVKLKNRGLSGVVRQMSSRVSSGLRNSFRRTSGRFRRDGPAGDAPQHRDSSPSTGSQMRNVEVALSTISEVTESTVS
ncbi:unnamed protein product [Lota lota]